VSSEIQAHLDEGVLHITLNRPDALNSLNASMHQALQRAFDRAQNTDVRAVLLTGSGRGFCAGQDLGEQSPEHPNYDPDLGQTIEKYYNPLIRKITQLPKPVICAVKGGAAGGGVMGGLACCVVFAR